MSDQTIMERLKTSTAEAHTAAENHAFQQTFVKGVLSRDSYTNYLGQMWLIHKGLETHLRRLSPAMPVFETVIRDYQYQEPYLAADLTHFGIDAGGLTPTPHTASLLADIEALASERPYALLGMHYVLEGSNNGSRFLARSVRSAYNLDTGSGDRYLDPYGDAQRGYWKQFKDDMNAAELTADERDDIEAGATAMFTAIMHVSDDLQQLIPA